MDHIFNQIHDIKSDLEYEIRTAVDQLQQQLDRLDDRIKYLQTRIEELETLRRD